MIHRPVACPAIAYMAPVPSSVPPIHPRVLPVGPIPAARVDRAAGPARVDRAARPRAEVGRMEQVDATEEPDRR
jgi:hypothetical protein